MLIAYYSKFLLCHFQSIIFNGKNHSEEGGWWQCELKNALPLALQLSWPTLQIYWYNCNIWIYTSKFHNFSLPAQLHNMFSLLVSVMWLYFVPSLLYCLYNNLSFINLSAYDPTTYFLLLQLRVVITGVVFQVNFYFLSIYTALFHQEKFLLWWKNPSHRIRLSRVFW